MKPEILIVEDDPIISQALIADLEEAGYQIRAICETGESALKAFEGELPDLVLMDIRLKGDMDGIQVAERILNRYRIPIIYLTDMRDQKTFQAAKQTHPSNYLTKPFQTHQLLLAVDLALFNNTTAYFGERFGFFKEKDVALKLAYDDILFLKSSRVYCEVWTSKRKITLAQPLKTIVKRIPYPDLIRVSRSYCVNKNQVDKIVGRMIMIGEERIPVGETYTHVLKNDFNVI